MMNNNYRLQLRHGAEGQNFSTRDDVFVYIDGQLQYGGVSLLPYEPILFYYGEDEKNTIIMVGLPEGKTNNGKSYFIIDTADLKEQINTIDEKYDTVTEELKAKDAELQEAIEKETEERKTADEAEAKAREDKDVELEKAIEDETEARTKKDEELQEALNFTKDDLNSVIEACGLIYNEKLADDRVSYESDSHDEVIRDAKDITEAIDKVSKFAAKLANDLKINVADTDTVSLTLEPNEKDGGNTITANVKIAGAEGLTKKNYDNNIIGKTVEGLYTSVSLEPSTSNPNKLIFKTSGYVNGAFKVDAFETEVNLTAYKGDNGNNTGVTVNVDTNENKISAQLNLSSDNNNILKLEDGKYIVEGTSKNITYKDSTVFTALNEQSNLIEEIEDTIEFIKAVDVKPSESDTVLVTVDKSDKGDFVVGANVKLSNDKSIIVSNGGLKADVSATFKKGTSTLFINVGDNEYPIDLSDLAVSVLKSAQYDAVTEDLILEFIVGDTTKIIRVPVGTFIHDVEVDDTDTIDMTLKSASGGPNHISAEVKVDNAHADNILTSTSNGLYVAKTYITEAVKDEANERKATDNEIKTVLDKVSELANSNKEAIATEANTARAAEKANADAIAQEIKEARKAEEANANAIAENKTAITANEVAIGAEEGRAKAAEQANATAITAEETRAKAAEVKNASDINAEITRATEKEADILEKIGNNTEKIGENKTAIVSEVERATKAEKEIDAKAVANDTAIKAEISRATAAESANATAIATEKTRATTAETELKSDIDRNKADIETANTAISSEVTRAKATEADLTTKLTDEITRAKAAEQVNATAITTEKERAEHIESDLLAKTQENADNIATLTSDVGNIELKKEGDLSYALYVNGTKHGEFTIPKDQFLKSVNYNTSTKELIFVFLTSKGETTTTVSIADLIDVYTAGEGLSLNGNTFSVNFTTVASVTAMQAAINAETTRAKGAEEANANAVVTEKERAMAAESVLDGKVANAQTIADGANVTASKAASDLAKEIERATAAESANATAISKEINDARTAENNLKTNLEGTIATEKERAEHVESDLLEKITHNSADIQSISTEVGNIELKKEGDLSYALYVKGTKHGEFTIPKDQFLKSVTYDPSTKDLVFVFVRTTGEVTTRVSIADLVNIYEAGNGLTLNGNVFSVDFSKVADASNVFTKDEITTKLGDYAKKADVEAELTNKLDSTLAANTYATQSDLNALDSVSAKKEDVNTQLSSKLNITEAKLTYATKVELQNVNNGKVDTDAFNNVIEGLNRRISNTEESIDNFNLTFNSATSDLVYTDKNGTTHTYKLYSGSLVKEGHFDTVSNSIVLTIQNGEIESQITIPVSQVISELSQEVQTNTQDIADINTALGKVAKDWETIDSQTISLTKTSAGEKDTLKAIVRVASSNKQAIQSTGDGLYVSNDLEDFTCVYGEEGTVSGQNAISKLLSETTKVSSKLDTYIASNNEKVSTIDTKVKELDTTVNNVKGDVELIKYDITNVVKKDIQTNKDAINKINDKVIVIEDNITNLDGRLITAETNINNIMPRVTNLETELTLLKNTIDVTIKGQITELKDTVSTLKTLIDSLVQPGGDISKLMDEINNIKNNLIGTKNNPTDGSVWYELNNMVDAGTF